MGAVMPTISSGLGALNTIVGASLPVLDAGQQIASVFSNDQKDAASARRLAAQQAAAERQRKLQAEQKLALQQLTARQQADTRDLQQRSTLERARLSSQAKADEEKRQAALRRAVARQRTQFASQGLSGTGEGSSEAVLLGLFDESEEDRAERERLDDIRNRALDQDVRARKNLNILQREQLAQRQQLERELMEF